MVVKGQEQIDRMGESGWADSRVNGNVLAIIKFK